MSLEKILTKRLQEHYSKDFVRQQITVTTPQATFIKTGGKLCNNFSSNDYLGLANHPSIVRAVKIGVQQYGFGSTSSRLISGNSAPHRDLEEKFSDFLQRESALLFSSGYLANLGVINAILSKNDHAFFDKYNHASLIDAGILSAGTIKRYNHSNLSHLDLLLQNQQAGLKLVVSDSVFSMSGSLAIGKQLAEITKKHQGYLMIDDAHGIGVLGKQGRGCIEHFALSPKDVPILVIPLGKAFGCYGAIVSGSKLLIDYLRQFARTYMYNTALPPVMSCAVNASLSIVAEETWRRERLCNLIVYFHQAAAQRNLEFLPSITPIQALVIGDATKTKHFGERLLQQGFLVAVIRPPSVPMHTARLRISLSALHTHEQINRLLDAIKLLWNS